MMSEAQFRSDELWALWNKAPEYLTPDVIQQLLIIAGVVSVVFILYGVVVPMLRRKYREIRELAVRDFVRETRGTSMGRKQRKEYKDSLLEDTYGEGLDLLEEFGFITLEEKIVELRRLEKALNLQMAPRRAIATHKDMAKLKEALAKRVKKGLYQSKEDLKEHKAPTTLAEAVESVEK